MLGGVIFLLLGGVIIYYSAAIVELTGRVAWAENNLGGTRQMYILGGVLGFFIGFLLLLGIVGKSSDSVNESTNLQLNQTNSQLNQ